MKATPVPKLRFRTHAKLNLFLRVVGRRPDGYHELESIFHGIRLGDDIEVTPTTTGDVEVDMRLEEGAVGEIPPPEENLIYRAAQSLLQLGARNAGVRIEVVKRIPIAGGLGGGSGNTAGALLALSEHWQMGFERDRILEIAGTVGSDVPYCIEGGTALATSKGETLTSLPFEGTIWFVLGVSREPLFTRDVYAASDELGPGEDVPSVPMALALGARDVRDVATLLHNDLERAALMLRPELAEKKRALLDAGAIGAGMTGSGPTLFGLLEDEEAAAAVASRVSGVFDRVLVVPSHPRCVEFLD